MLRALCCVLLLFSGTLAARDAHVHGEAQLTIAADHGVLNIELHTPMANLVGFEHEPHTARQVRAIHTAAATLRAADALFQINADADCALDAARVKLAHADTAHAQTAAAARNEPTEARHHHHKHDAAHAPERASDHDDAEHAAHDESATTADDHADGFAGYRFSCRQPQRLTAIHVGLLKQFPGMQTIKAVWVTADGQGRKTLHAGDDTLTFRPTVSGE